MAGRRSLVEADPEATARAGTAGGTVFDRTRFPYTVVLVELSAQRVLFALQSEEL